MQFIKKHIHRLPFLLLMLLMIFSIITYLTQQDMVITQYEQLGFPIWVMYFNLTVKILGVIVLLVPKMMEAIKIFAWAGFLYVFLLGFFAHIMVDDGQRQGAAIAITLRTIATVIHYKRVKNICANYFLDGQLVEKDM